MSDVADDAQVHEDHYQRLAMVAHCAQLEQTPQVIVGGKVCCMDCDEPILAARLLILPNAMRCVDCQELWELEKRG